MDNKANRVYSWDFELDFNSTQDWIVNKEYKNSPIQFEIPAVISGHKLTLSMILYNMQTKFYQLVSPTINKVLAAIPTLNELPPISLIYDFDNNDYYLVKAERQFFCFVAVVLFFIF